MTFSRALFRLVALGVSTVAPAQLSSAGPRSAEYQQVQERLARGWNTWDVNSVTTQVLLPDGLAVHVGLKHNGTEFADAWLGDALIGRQGRDDEQIFPGPHAWDGSYTDLKLNWRGHNLRLQSAHDGDDLVLLATPIASEHPSSLPPTLVFSVGYLWNLPGTVLKREQFLEVHGQSGETRIYSTGTASKGMYFPISGPYLATDFTSPVGLSAGKPRSVTEIQDVLDRQQSAYEHSLAPAGASAPIADAIQTTLGWDTIYEPQHHRVVSPVSRVWSVGWGGYVIFDWDTFFAATMAGIGDKDLANADAIETLRESTPQGFVPNYARAGDWKSEDRSEPPVGAITVLGLYQKFHDRWLLTDTFTPLMNWNRWWAENRDMQGYLVWGSDGPNQPANLDDDSRGTRQAAILESGLDNSPMYDHVTYNPLTHQMELADVGLMSMYIADCDALATMADILGKTAESRELHDRAAKYRTKLATLWDEKTGIFLNRDLHTGESGMRLSPTNFYPLMAHAATPAQADRMIKEHLLNPHEFWGDWIIPSIALNDPAFKDQDYWRGRIWGPMNYLVYLGLRNYDQPEVRRQFAQRSLDLFLREWREKGHVHENYNAILGSGDDVSSSDRFYHWGALLGYIQYMEQTSPPSR
jgi:putative isomerase